MSLEKNDKLVWVDINELKPHPENANKHPQSQIEQLAKIINYQGFRSPIIVSNRSGFITVGHGRLEAAKLNGLTRVPVSYQDYDDELQEIAHMHSDNSIALQAEIDMTKVTETLREINFDLDVDFLGFKDFKFTDEKHESVEKTKNTNKEVDLDDLTKDLNTVCPKCGFEFESEES